MKNPIGIAVIPAVLPTDKNHPLSSARMVEVDYLDVEPNNVTIQDESSDEVKEEEFIYNSAFYNKKPYPKK